MEFLLLDIRIRAVISWQLKKDVSTSALIVSSDLQSASLHTTRLLKTLQVPGNSSS